jgi:hypothetical protein
MTADERLPEHDAHRPDIGAAAGLLACQSLGRDIRERSGHVAGRSQRLGLAHLREPEVEDPDRYLAFIHQHHVRRLHIAVDDTFAVRVPQGVEHLRGRFHGGGVVEGPAAQSFAKRSSRHELVGDVDVLVVPVERERPEAARMAQPGRRLHLPLRARPGLAFSRDDLERDVASGRLVSYEPDRTGPAAAQGPQGSVAPEDEPPVQRTGFTEGDGMLHGPHVLGPDS